MKGTRKTKKMMSAISALAAVALLAGSFAYWNQTHKVENPFNTGAKYGSTVIENFNPNDGEDWQPGVEVEKKVGVVNTGDQDLLVRIKLDEKWVRVGAANPYKELKAEVDGNKIYIANQAVADDGLVAADDSVVEKHLSTSTKWVNGGDGWWYYTVNLKEGETTDKWLESVELLDNVDLGAQEVKKYITKDATITATTVWVEYTGDMPTMIGADPVRHNKTDVVYKTDGGGNDLIGYVNSDYTLSITTQTVQATKEAVMATFGKTESQLSALPVSWTYAD